MGSDDPRSILHRNELETPNLKQQETDLGEGAKKMSNQAKSVGAGSCTGQDKSHLFQPHSGWV